MSLIETLGVDPERAEWKELAQCKGITFNGPEQDPFYDAYITDEEVAIQTDEMCLSCPVMAKCAAEGVELKEFGVWGGVYLEKGKVDKNRNAHKTPEAWDRIRERLSEA